LGGGGKREKKRGGKGLRKIEGVVTVFKRKRKSPTLY